MKSITIMVVAFLSLASLIQAETPQWRLDKNHSMVSFAVKHLMVTNVKGNFTEYDATVLAEAETGKVISVEATVQVKSINTGITQRDDHLRSEDFFDAVKFPTLQFKSTAITWNENEVSITGDLTMKDVTKAVILKGEFLGMRVADMGGGETKFAGYSLRTQVDRTEFNLNFSKAVNGTLVVDNLVKIELDIELHLPVAKAE